MVLGFFKWNLFFVLAIGSFCFQWHGDKEDQQMEMRWCLITFKPLCCFLLFGVCVCCCWTQDDCVARELPSEVHLAKISRSNSERMCYSEDK